MYLKQDVTEGSWNWSLMYLKQDATEGSLWCAACFDIWGVLPYHTISYETLPQKYTMKSIISYFNDELLYVFVTDVSVLLSDLILDTCVYNVGQTHAV